MVKQDYIKEAYRYLSNAKETLAKSPIEYGRYQDEKYVREAAGIAYLAGLKAIDGYLIEKGLLPKELPKSIEEYWVFVKKHIPINGKFYSALSNSYENLHIAAYYRGLTEISLVKGGFENVKRVIEVMEQLIRGRRKPGTLRVNEAPVTYRRMRKKKAK